MVPNDVKIILYEHATRHLLAEKNRGEHIIVQYDKADVEHISYWFNQHANDYAASHNDYDDFHYMSTHDLWKEYKRLQELWDKYESEVEV